MFWALILGIVWAQKNEFTFDECQTCLKSNKFVCAKIGLMNLREFTCENATVSGKYCVSLSSNPEKIGNAYFVCRNSRSDTTNYDGCPNDVTFNQNVTQKILTFSNTTKGCVVELNVGYDYQGVQEVRITNLNPIDSAAKTFIEF